VGFQEFSGVPGGQALVFEIERVKGRGKALCKALLQNNVAA
jgi:hypothetical protein